MRNTGNLAVAFNRQVVWQKPAPISGYLPFPPSQFNSGASMTSCQPLLELVLVQQPQRVELHNVLERHHAANTASTSAGTTQGRTFAT